MIRIAWLIAAAFVIAGCGAAEPVVTRADVVELEMGGTRTVDVVENDLPGGALVVTDVRAMARSAVHASVRGGLVEITHNAGDDALDGRMEEHRFTYTARYGERTAEGVLVVRVLEDTTRLTLDPPVIDFGLVPIDARATESVEVTVSGEGEEPLTIEIDGLDSELVADTSDCNHGNSTSCAVSLSFEPAAEGIVMRVLTFRVAGVPAVELYVSGVGVRVPFAEFAVRGSDVDFGSVEVGSPQPRATFAFVNIGSDALIPTATVASKGLSTSIGNCGVVAAGDTCEFRVRLSTSSPLRIVDSEVVIGADVVGGGLSPPDSTSVLVSGHVVDPKRSIADFDLSPDANLSADDPSQRLVLKNTGEVELPSLSLRASAPAVLHLVAEPGCTSLQPGQSCGILATISEDTLATGASESVEIVAESLGITRTATVHVDVAPPLLGFRLDVLGGATIEIGQPVSVAVANIGDRPLNGHEVRVDPAGIATAAATSECSPLPVDGEGCVITVALEPDAPVGSHPIVLKIGFDAVPEQGIELLGMVPPTLVSAELDPPRIRLTPNNVEEVVTVRNTGEVDIPLDMPESDVVLFDPHGCSAVLGPGERCSVSVVLDPSVLDGPIDTIEEVLMAGETLTIDVDVAAQISFELTPTAISVVESNPYSPRMVEVVNTGEAPIEGFEIPDQLTFGTGGVIDVESKGCERIVQSCSIAFYLVREATLNHRPEVDVRVGPGGAKKTIAIAVPTTLIFDPFPEPFPEPLPVPGPFPLPIPGPL